MNSMKLEDATEDPAAAIEPVSDSPATEPDTLLSEFDDPALYLNRELAQIEFNSRVMAQAEDPRNPLLERLRFMCISCTNLDEFFEVRVAVLKHHHAFGEGQPRADAMSITEILALIRERTLTLVKKQYAFWNGTLLPELKREGIQFLVRKVWTNKQKRWLQGYFRNETLPVLSPLGLDPAHPFPRILNKSLTLAVVLSGKDAFGREGHMALLRAPRSLPRIIRLPDEISEGCTAFVFLSDLLHEFMDELFPGMQVKGSYQFRVTRNSELFVDEEEVENLALALRDELRGRGYAKAVRLEVGANCPRAITNLLEQNFELSDQDVYLCEGPVNVSRSIAIYDQIDRPDLKFPAFVQRIRPPIIEGDSLFAAIRERDILLHHPFDSFATVSELVKQASLDPGVLAIKQTLYRAGTDSQLVDHLIEAARHGKDVTVVVELRARFDEEANLRLANRLQEAGVQVVYGVVGFKTHAKMLLIVRREADGLRRYVHLSTGNYHQVTSRIYTDFGLMTAHPGIGEDAHLLFLQLSGLGPIIRLKHLMHSPFTLHKGLIAKIERETEHALAGKKARIIAKINALNEPAVIKRLYAASCAGVEIDLIVRGACTLRPGIPGVSENIRVRSIVGRFLEHSRVYWFQNLDRPEIFCSSADWLDRNLLRRVETCFPILDRKLAKRVFEESLQNYLADNMQAWQLESDGSYRRVSAEGKSPHSAQSHLLEKICP